MKKVREKLNAKLRKSGGFTLVEMLIVVAIIAILIAISIPMISSNLERAREATDAANLRSAQSLAVAYYLTESSDPDSTETFASNTTTAAEANANYVYEIDATSHQGAIKKKGTTTTGPNYEYGLANSHQKKYVWLVIRQDGTVDADWAA